MTSNITALRRPRAAKPPSTRTSILHPGWRAIAWTAASLLCANGCKASTQDANQAHDSRSAETEAGSAGLVGISPLAEHSRLTIPVTAVRGIPVAELSGLAWDDDERLLYAVSDRGNVFHFRLALEGNTIRASEPVYAAALSDLHTKGSPNRRFNAEGLITQNAANGKTGDTVLIVSLEGGDRPRIVRFNPSGAMLGELEVPSPSDDVRNYRKKGQGLESIAYHPAHGLMTAPEAPLQSQPENQHALYAKNRHWSFARRSSGSRLKAMDITEAGKALVLERSHLNASDALEVSIRQIDLAACPRSNACAAGELALLPGVPENFEGMTVLGDGRVLIVSDDGGDKDPQSTTLILLVSQ